MINKEVESNVRKIHLALMAIATMVISGCSAEPMDEMACIRFSQEYGECLVDIGCTKLQIDVDKKNHCNQFPAAREARWMAIERKDLPAMSKEECVAFVEVRESCIRSEDCKVGEHSVFTSLACTDRYEEAREAARKAAIEVQE